MSDYHVPVMLHECVEGLNIDPTKTYVDVTFGGGGHSREILKHLTTGKLVVFDQDPDAKKNAEAINDDRLIFCAANFRYLKRYLRLHGIKSVAGILGDLGISSHQIDETSRGFSTRGEAPLDMRMAQSGSISAKEVINEYDEGKLKEIFKLYGEITHAGKAASLIIHARSAGTIETTLDLMNALRPMAPRGKENRFFAQVFQAIRIEVNEELETLREMLEQGAEVLEEGGHFVIESYHSLEDRLVKNFFKAGNFEGKHEKDFYGNILRPLKPLKSKPITASNAEIAQNRRARSAKLRIGVKLAENNNPKSDI
ncbi:MULTISPECIES: 16S rRNA (cytosine(1402)-N(4))-methyltransferase RsmH [Flammeovirga]|uniref:Ribosomal RNA small subunit methyltransferase H n=1 Tax=Flammeovirga agarivorans TaxID=2726742 RepID=A0A7X8SIZ6_9BACT|nr:MULTISPECIES: 16S rRNA (cytosine(1402)-N(4))-methyltransferase RsmH [Flammeovirga]NLR91017.1 16S rRNA (cytosine(1402)-N(4))-methyltransferase RsmH [Flammeovirga agarivorans]